MKLSRFSRCPITRIHLRRSRLWIECLEDRTLLSGSGLGFANPNYVIHHSAGTVAPLGSSVPTGSMPSQVRHAYGLDRITFAGGVTGDGSGTTIAIVDAYDNPNIASDLHQFDLQFHFPDPTFTKVNQSGGTVFPAANSSWAGEIALDVEWAHAIAPAAKILLVEARDNSFTNIFAAVTYAASQPGVVAVSMSWGGSEDPSETAYDRSFLTPPGHSGVTFIAAAGDNGAPPGYPATSPNVLAIGGTTLSFDSQGNYLGESAWSGSGGGISSIEAQPAYQKGVVTQSSTFRTNPDVAYDADPNTGVPVYDSYNNGTATPWSQFGGTSVAAPQWSGLIALADQGRALAGKGTLDGSSQTLPMLYQLSSTDFHDITSGGSRGRPPYSAGPGYDLVTGRGTPVASKIVTDLGGNTILPSKHFNISAPAGATAGSALSVTVTALDQNNNTITSYTGTVHFTSSDGTASLPANYTFTAADKGVHTFTNGVTLKKAGSDTLTVSDASAPSITGSVTLSVTAARPNHLGFSQQPTNTVAGSRITPAVTVQVLDLYNNLVSLDNTDTVSVAVAGNGGNGTLSGTTTATVSNGRATFSNLWINKTGNGYTLKASAGTLGSTMSAAFNITPGKASQLVFGQQPTNSPAGTAISPAVTVRVLDAYGNLVSSDSSHAVTIGLGADPGGGSLSGTLTVTARNGVASFSSLAISKAGTGYTLVASSGGLAGSTSAAFDVTLASSSTVVGASVNPSVLGQAVTFTATVAASALGGGTPTGTVQFQIDGTNFGSAVSLSSAGTASFSTASLAVGTHTVTASYSGNASFATSSGTLSGGQAVNQDSTSTAVASSANPSVFGQSVTFTATVKAGDPGNGTPSGTVQFQIDGTNVGSPVSLSSGVATSAATSSLSVSGHTVQAIYSGDTNFATSTGTLTQTVNPAAASVLIVSGFPSPTTAGATGTFTVTVQDSSGNTVPGYRGTVHFTSSDFRASVPADYTFTATDNGVHTFSAAFETAANQSLTATDTVSGGITGTQSGIAVTPAAADHFVVVPSVATTVAGTLFDVTVTVQDSYNNTVTGYTGTVAFSSADPYGASLPVVYTFTAADIGGHTFAAGAALYSAGSWDLTVTDTLAGVAGSGKVTVTPASAVRFRIVAPDTAASNTPFDVTVTALDPYRNVDTNYQGTITFSTTDPDPGVILPANYIFTGNDAGAFTAGVTLVTPGDQMIIVTDAGGLRGSATITVTAPELPPGGGAAQRVGKRGAAAEMTMDWSSAGIVRTATLSSGGPDGGAGRRDQLGREISLKGGAESRKAVPRSERPSPRRPTLLRIKEAVDQLFAAGYERFLEMSGVM